MHGTTVKKNIKCLVHFLFSIAIFVWDRALFYSK